MPLPPLTRPQAEFIQGMYVAQTLCVCWDEGVYCRIYEREKAMVDRIVAKGYLTEVSSGTKYERTGVIFNENTPPDRRRFQKAR